ncbi:MAG: hypothetical protein LIO67_04140 [Lachnospiraceae bacterium]|nr:hypothetical protein [Lachnospiraceae bacterium]
MMAYENDNLLIPEEYKKMSVSEIEREKERMLQEINSAGRSFKKAKRANKQNIVLRF